MRELQRSPRWSVAGDCQGGRRGFKCPLMSLTLHCHPLSSFCWKALIGLYELEIPFEKHVVDLSNDAARADLVRLWPLGKFPVLRDHARECTVPESTIILEYIDRLRPGGPRLIPSEPDRALECRLRD